MYCRYSNGISLPSVELEICFLIMFIKIEIFINNHKLKTKNNLKTHVYGQSLSSPPPNKRKPNEQNNMPQMVSTSLISQPWFTHIPVPSSQG